MSGRPLEDRWGPQGRDLNLDSLPDADEQSDQLDKAAANLLGAEAHVRECFHRDNLDGDALHQDMAMEHATAAIRNLLAEVRRLRAILDRHTPGVFHR